MMKNKTFTLKALSILVLVVAFAACSKKVAPVETPSETYTGPEVSYAKDISPLLERSCSPCHYPAKDGSKLPLDNYKAVKSNLADMLKMVQLPESDEHFMPFKKKKQPLSAEEIEMMKNWARGGFME